jgi:predicted kinase
MILLCGLPGSGKTTLAKRLASEVPAVRLSPDEWLIDLGVDLFDEPFRARLERRFRKLAQDVLILGQNVVLESGFWTRAERDEMLAAGREVGALVELRYLAVPFDELVRRLDARDSSTLIPEKLLAEYEKVFEAPDEDELALFDQVDD